MVRLHPRRAPLTRAGSKRFASACPSACHSCAPTDTLQHRPRTLEDIVGNVDTIERLKVIARDGNCPHIIISVRLPRVPNPTRN